MGYKFLEIEINVGPSSYVEITLGDNHEQELSLSLETWKDLYERWIFTRCFEITNTKTILLGVQISFRQKTAPLI